jgi:single-strand DNA-binding protein
MVWMIARKDDRFCANQGTPTNMAGSVNKVILVGNLGGDPEVRSMQNGGKVANFRMATSQSWKDKTSGERKERTEWHSIVIFNERLVEIAQNYLKKGSKVYVEGELRTRKTLDQNGQERDRTEVVLDRFRGEITMLDRAPAGAGADMQSGNGEGRSASYSRSGSARPGAVSKDFDDDIPF